MDTESQRIYARMSLHKLLLEHPDWKDAQLAQALGYSKRWVQKWKARFKSVETPNFKMYLSQSRAPHHRPNQTSDTLKDVICDLRVTLSEDYHRNASATLIHLYLQQHPELVSEEDFVPSSSRTITRILRERGYIQPRSKRDHEPLPLCAPMEEWEMDFCEIRLQDGRFEFFIVVDRGTSRVVHLEGCVEGYQADTALLAVYRLFLLNGLPKRLRMDRDPRFVWSWSADSFPAPLIRLLHAVGVEPVICPPRRPDLKPYVERCIRTFKHEWLDRFSLDTLADCYEALEAFPDYHNRQRIHLGRACRGRTPDEAFPELPGLPQLPDEVASNRWLMVEHGRVFRRRIRSNGSIQVDKHTYYVDQKQAKRRVLVHLDGENRCFHVTIDGQLHPKTLSIKDLYPARMSTGDYLKALQTEAMSIAAYRRSVWMQTGDAA